MAFEISTTRWFSASHQLRFADGSLEPLHGHNWRVRVTVAARELDGMDLVMDFHELERLVDGVISRWHNGHLNAFSEFEKLNPSAEGVALHVYRSLKMPAGRRVSEVRVWETRENSAAYGGD